MAEQSQIDKNRELVAAAFPRLSAPTAVPQARLTQPITIGKGVQFGGTTGKKADGGDKGILSGVASIIPNAVGAIGRGIGGIPQFVGKGVQTAVGFGEGIMDLGLDIVNEDMYTSRFETDLEKGRKLGLQGDALVSYAAQRQYPLAQMIIQSGAGTGRRVAELATGGRYDYGDPGIDYARAFRQGKLGEMLVEDVGNVILAGRAVGAGNVIAGAGSAIAETAPRLGRAVSSAGRLIEEPIGESARLAGRGAVSLGRILEKPALETAGRRLYYNAPEGGLQHRPIREAVNMMGEKWRERNYRVQEKYNSIAAALEKQAEATTSVTERNNLAKQAEEMRSKAERATIGTGVVGRGRKTVWRMTVATERATQQITAAFRRLSEKGSIPESPADLRRSAENIRANARRKGYEGTELQNAEANAREFERRADIKERNPEYFDQPLQPWVSGGAVLTYTGLGAEALRLANEGLTDAEIAIRLQSPEVTPSLEQKSMQITPEMVQAAREFTAYLRGDMNAMPEGKALAMQGYYELLRAWGDVFDEAMRQGIGLPEGPMPLSYFMHYPEPTFLYDALQAWPDQLQNQALRILEFQTAEAIFESIRQGIFTPEDWAAIGINIDGIRKAMEKITPDDLAEGAETRPFMGLYKKVVNAGPNTIGYEIATMVSESSFPFLRELAPEQMMNPDIYPAKMRTVVLAQRQDVRARTAADVADMTDQLSSLVNEFQTEMPKQIVEGALRDIEKAQQPGVAVTKTAWVRMSKRINTALQSAIRERDRLRAAGGLMDRAAELNVLELERAIDALTRANEMVRMLSEEVAGKRATPEQIAQAEAEVAQRTQERVAKEAQARGWEEVARQQEAVYGVSQPIGRLKRVTERTTETVAEPAPPAPTPEVAPTPPTPSLETPIAAPADVSAPGQPLGLRAESALPEGLSFSVDNPLSTKEVTSFITRGLKDDLVSFIANVQGQDFLVNRYQIIAVSELPKKIDPESFVIPSDSPRPNIEALVSSAPSFTPIEIVGYVKDNKPNSGVPVSVIFKTQDGQLVEVAAERIASFLGRNDVRFTSAGPGKAIAVYKGDKLVGFAQSLRSVRSLTFENLMKGGDDRLVAPASNQLAVELHKRGLWLIGKGPQYDRAIYVAGRGSSKPFKLSYDTVNTLTGVDPAKHLADIPYAVGKGSQPYEIPSQLRQQFDAENLQLALEKDRGRGRDRTDDARKFDVAKAKATLEGKNPKDTLDTRVSIAVAETLASNPTSPKFIIAPSTKSAAVRISDVYEPGTVFIIENGRAVDVTPRPSELHKTVELRRDSADYLGKERALDYVYEGKPETAAAPVLRPVETPAPAPAPAPAEPTLRTVTRTTTRLEPVATPPARFPAGREVAGNVTRAQLEARKARAQEAAAKRSLTKATELITSEQRAEVNARLKGIGYVKGSEPVLKKGIERKLNDTSEQLQNKQKNIEAKLEDIRAKEAAQEPLIATAGEMAATPRLRDQAMGPDFLIGPELFNPETDVIGYFPTGPTRGARPRATTERQILGEGAGAQNVPSFAKQRRTAALVMTPQDMSAKLVEVIRQMNHNQTVELLLRDPKITSSVQQILGEDWWQTATEEATKSVMAQATNQLRTADEIERAVQREVGDRAIRELESKGYEPVSRVDVDPNTGGHAAVGALDQPVTGDNMSPDTFVMRKGVKNRLMSDYKKVGSTDTPTVIERVLDLVGRGTYKWKSVILPISLRWQLGDAVSNVMNAWLRGDIKPQELLRASQEVVRRLTDPADASVGNLLFGDLMTQAFNDPVLAAIFGAGLQGRGLRLEEMLFNEQFSDRLIATLQDPAAKTRVGEFFNQARGKAFRLNEAQNSIARAGVALIKLEENLAAVGRTLDEVNGVSAIKDPVISRAIHDAVDATNDMLGSFSELTPWEKSVMRQLFPFWSWIKFINKAAAEIAIDSPDRVLFYAHMGSMATDPDQNGFLDFLQGKTPVGPYLFDLNFLNPYQDAMIFNGNPLTATAEQFTSISPIITTGLGVGAEAIYGATGRQFPFLTAATRPGYLEGRPGATARTLGDTLGGMAYIGLKNLGGPARNILELLPTGTIPGTDIATGPGPKYPQGSARTTGMYAMPRLSGLTGRLSAIGRTFGIPSPVMETDVAIKQSKEQAQRDKAARLRRIKERKAAKGG